MSANHDMNEARKLERELAYSAARSDIECHLMSEQHSGKYYGRWYDTTSADSSCSVFVDKAIRYLELRNLLKRHPEREELIKIIGTR